MRSEINQKLSSSTIFRSSHPEVFLGKGVLKIWSKFTREHPCQSAISIKLLCHFNEIALRHGCFPANLLHIFRKPFPKNTFGRLLLYFLNRKYYLHQVLKAHLFLIYFISNLEEVLNKNIEMAEDHGEVLDRIAWMNSAKFWTCSCILVFSWVDYTSIQFLEPSIAY